MTASDLKPADAAAATDRDSWLTLMDQIGEEAGYFQTVGACHWAMFVDESPTLIVSFETVDQARARTGQMPQAHGLAARHGWSHLCVIADGETWYRDPAVYAFFDRLIDDAFFEDFDRVLFMGAGMGGYAATAFSVCAPGCTVLATSPRATLDPAQAGWDPRNRAARKLDFTARFGYAPDMVEGAGRVFLIHDPMNRVEAMHVALFRAPYVTPLPARHSGERLDQTLTEMDVMPGLVEAAVDGTLDRVTFAKAWRKRRDHGAYLRTILGLAAAAGSPAREIMVCRSVTRRHRAPKFHRRLAELTGTKPITVAGADSV